MLTTAGLGERTLRALVAKVFVVWAVVYFSAGQLDYALSRGNQLTEYFDAYSEADAIRAGEGFADQGFTHHDGLPELSYGTEFESVGSKHNPNICTKDPCVYLHYPPGAVYVLGVMTKICGKGDVPCFRFAPLLVGALSLAFFAWAVSRTMGVERAALVLGSFYFAPMITNAMHYLYCHGYMTSFQLVQIGLLLFLFVRPAKEPRLVLGGLFLVGFCQGWISFDDAFHVAFLSVPLWLMSPDWRARWRDLCFATAAACGGYAFAFFLHFYQVADFLGTWTAAFHDFANRASQRAGGEIEAGLVILSRTRLLLTYWTQGLSGPHFFGFNFLAVCAAVFVALLADRGIAVSRRRGVAWRPLPSFKWAFVAAFVIPDLWLLAMRQHATVHKHFLGRNFAVTYVVGALLLAQSLRSAPAATESEARPV